MLKVRGKSPKDLENLSGRSLVGFSASRSVTNIVLKGSLNLKRNYDHYPICVCTDRFLRKGNLPRSANLALALLFHPFADPSSPSNIGPVKLAFIPAHTRNTPYTPDISLFPSPFTSPSPTPSVPFHRLLPQLGRHLFYGIPEGGAGHAGFTGHYEIEHFLLVRLARYLEEPSIPLLHHVVGVAEERFSDGKHIGKELACTGWHDEGHSRSSSHPSVIGFGPPFQVLDEGRVPLHEGPNGVVTEGVTGRPVGNVQAYPRLEHGKILRLILGSQCIGPMAGDEGFLQVAGPPELFAAGKDDLFPLGLQGFEKGSGHSFHLCRFHPVQLHFFLEEPASALPNRLIAIPQKLFSNLLNDGMHTRHYTPGWGMFSISSRIFLPVFLHKIAYFIQPLILKPIYSTIG